LVVQLAAFLIFFPDGWARAQAREEKVQAQREQALLRHEVKVTLKLVQVYVTDKKGNPVLGLTKDDFVVLDEGQKQQLTEFERHVLALPGEKEEAPPKVVETPAPPARDLMPRKFFLLFDFAYNNAQGILKAREAALRFIDTQLQPQDEVGVLSYSAMKSLKLHEYLTTDHKKVREAVKGFGVEQVVGRAENFEEKYWRYITGERVLDAGEWMAKTDTLDRAAAGGEFVQKMQFAEDSRVQVLNFGQRLSDLAKALRYVPGHKNILLFSSGVPYSLVYGIQVPFGATQAEADSTPGREFGSWGESLLRQKFDDMLKEMSSANCAIYALDTMELGSGIKTDTRMLGAFSLQKMTSATGGKYFGNINNHEKHIDKIQDLTGCYYVLGYYVDDTWDGAYHNIKVEVAKPGLKVHAQKGYFNPKPFTEYSDLERMLHLVDLALSEEPLFQTPVRFPLEVVPCPEGGEGDLCLAAEVQVEKIREVLAGKSEFVAVIFDDQENIVALKRNEKKTYTLEDEFFSFGTNFSLPPGRYQCRLVIRNLETGRGAVAATTAVIQGN
jgi:VWFA-related protein